MVIKDYVLERKKSLKTAISKEGGEPNLYILQVYDSFASNKYIRGKIEDAAFVGIKTMHVKYTGWVEEEQILNAIRDFNNDPNIDGIIVQLPLPDHISEEKVKLAIDPAKDVDGFHPLSHFDPCTPLGIMNYLKAENVEMRGKNALVIGRSNIVGKPMARLLLATDANVTVVHSKTSKEDLAFYLKHADIIVAAVGIKHFINDQVLKKDAVIIDVGINPLETGGITGDVAPMRDVKLQTPVPGGVGLLTRLTLLENVFKAYKNNKGNK